jgi:hypothetical protein
MKKSTPILLMLLALTAIEALAQPRVYRSIDAEGNVTYSETPTPEGAGVVEEVPLAPPPTEAQRRDARQRAQGVEQELQRGRQRREAAREEQSTAVAAAQEELEEARNDLNAARVKTVDDWQTLATGGRVLKQSYLDRVARAQDRVKAAEEALRRALRGG